MQPRSLEYKQAKPEDILFIENWFVEKGYENIFSSKDELGFWEISNAAKEFELRVKKTGKDFIIQLIDFSGGAMGLGSDFIKSLIEKLKQMKTKRIIANNCSPESISFYRKNNFKFIGLNAEFLIE